MLQWAEHEQSFIPSAQVYIRDLPETVHSVKGGQWLSGGVLDSRLKGRGFEPHRRHCVVVLEQDIFIQA